MMKMSFSAVDARYERAALLGRAGYTLGFSMHV